VFEKQRQQLGVLERFVAKCEALKAESQLNADEKALEDFKEECLEEIFTLFGERDEKMKLLVEFSDMCFGKNRTRARLAR